MQNWMNTYLEAFLIVILPTLTQSRDWIFFFFFSDAKYFGLEVSPQDAARVGRNGKESGCGGKRCRGRSESSVRGWAGVSSPWDSPRLVYTILRRFRPLF